jgi:hypothetical protein
MKTYGGVDVYIHVFLTLALVGSEWSASRPGLFTPDTFLIGCWVGPRTSLDDMERRKIMPPMGLELCPLRPSSLKPVIIPTELSKLHDFVYIFFYYWWGGTKSLVLQPLLAYCTNPR